MSSFESKLKKENEIMKELFNFNGDKTELEHLKKVFTNFISSTDNGPKYFIKLLDLYSVCRPHQHFILIQLIDCIFTCFSDQSDEIQLEIKKHTIYLKHVIFPEEI